MHLTRSNWSLVNIVSRSIFRVLDRSFAHIKFGLSLVL